MSFMVHLYTIYGAEQKFCKTACKLQVIKHLFHSTFTWVYKQQLSSVYASY